MPAGNSTRTPTRSRAACTASASRWSTRCPRGSICASSATARSGSCAFTTACPRRRSAEIGPAPALPEGSSRARPGDRHRDHLSAEHRDLHQDRVRLHHPRAPAARARLPEQRRHAGADRCARGRAEDRHAPLRGRARSLCPISRPLEAGAARAADRDPRRARRHHRRNRDGVDRQLSRDDAVLYQQHPAARRRHPSRRLPRGADPHASTPTPTTAASPKRKRSR